MGVGRGRFGVERRMPVNGVGAVRTFILLVGLLGLPAWGQGVYVTPGENGPLFSDKPRAGARELRLRPLSVIPAEKVRGAGQALSGSPASPTNAASTAAVAAAPRGATAQTAAPGGGDVPIIPGLPSAPFPEAVETRQP